MSETDPQTHLSGDEYAGARPRPSVSGDAAPDDLTADPRDGSGGAAVTDLPDDPAALREQGREREAWDESTSGNVKDS